MAEEKEEGTDNSADGAVRYGISTGLREILENHPDLIRYGDVLGGHIDGQKFGAEKNRIFTETNEAARNGKFASYNVGACLRGDCQSCCFWNGF
jgi:hypothetical protein